MLSYEQESIESASAHLVNLLKVLRPLLKLVPQRLLRVQVVDRLLQLEARRVALRHHLRQLAARLVQLTDALTGTTTHGTKIGSKNL